MLVSKLLLRHLIVETILRESNKNILIQNNPGLEKYDNYLSKVQSKYHSWLGGLFDEYKKNNSDISYGSIIFLALMHQKYAKTDLIPNEAKDFKRLNLEQTVNVIQDIGAQYTDSALYNELIAIDRQETLSAIPEIERQEQIAVTKDNTKVANGLTLLKTIYDNQNQPLWQIFYPESAEGSQKIGVEAWCTVYSDAFSTYWNQGIRLYYVLAYDPEYETKGYGYDYSTNPYKYISLGFRPEYRDSDLDADGLPVEGSSNIDPQTARLVLDGEDSGVSVFGNQQGVNETNLKNVLKQSYDDIIGFIRRHHKAVNKTHMTQKDISGRPIAEKYAETRASVLRVFKREIRAMNPNDSFKMIKDVLKRISTRDKGAVSAGQRQVRDHIFEKYLMRVDNKMKRSDVYQRGKYEFEMCVEFLKASIDSDERQIEYIIDLATTEGFLDNIAVAAIDDAPHLAIYPFWDNENLTDRTIEMIEDKVTPVIDIWLQELNQVEYIDANEDDPDDNEVIPNPDHFFAPSNIQLNYFNTILTHINHPTVNRVFRKSFELGKYDKIVDYVLQLGLSSDVNFSLDRLNPRKPMSAMFLLVSKIISTTERTTSKSVVFTNYVNDRSYKTIGFPEDISQSLLIKSLNIIKNMSFEELFSVYNKNDLGFRHMWDTEYRNGRRDRVGYPIRKQVDPDSPEIDFTPKEKAGMEAEIAYKILRTFTTNYSFYFYNTEGTESTKKIMNELRKYEKTIINAVAQYGTGRSETYRDVRTTLIHFNDLEVLSNEAVFGKLKQLLEYKRGTPGGLEIVTHNFKDYVDKYIMEPYEPGKYKGHDYDKIRARNQYTFQDSIDRVKELEDLLNLTLLDKDDPMEPNDDEFIRQDLMEQLASKLDQAAFLVLAREDRDTFKRLFIAGNYHHTSQNVKHLASSFNTDPNGTGRYAPGNFVRLMFGIVNGITSLWRSGYLVDEEDALKLHSEVVKCIDEMPPHAMIGGPFFRRTVEVGGGEELISASRKSLIRSIRETQQEIEFDAQNPV